jgi:hemerythrin-like domain-containing protein
MTRIEGVLIEPEAPFLLSQPLDGFAAEHQRHREVCRLAVELAAAGDFDARPLAAIAAFIRRDLALHIRDEEDDLFPLLRRRALPEDEIDACLDRLAAEHRQDEQRAAAVIRGLETCLERRRAPGREPAARAALEAFAAHELRHLALENAVVLPIARRRLTADDLGDLARRLAARRGLLLEPAPG